MYGRKIITAVCLSAVLVGVATTDAKAPSRQESVPQTSFHIIQDFKVVHRVSRPQRPRVVNKPKVAVVSTPKPKVSKPVTKHTVYGQASWYCRTGVSRCTRGHAGGFYAAIRRDLLFLRGKTVTITYRSKSIRVKLIDCNCGPHANLIDLYSDAYRALAPLSTGRMNVSLKW